MGRFRSAMSWTGSKIKKGFTRTTKAVGVTYNGAKRVGRAAALGAIIGAGIGNGTATVSNNYRATQGSLRKGAEMVLVEQAKKQARENAGRFDRALMGAGLKATLTPQQLIQIQKDAKTYGGVGATLKNMPKKPSIDLTPSGLKNTGKGAMGGAGAGVALLGTAAAIAAMKRRRASRVPPRTP